MNILKVKCALSHQNIIRWSAKIVWQLEFRLLLLLENPFQNTLKNVCGILQRSFGISGGFLQILTITDCSSCKILSMLKFLDSGTFRVTSKRNINSSTPHHLSLHYSLCHLDKQWMSLSLRRNQPLWRGS